MADGSNHFGASVQANLLANPDKLIKPAKAITAFNCALTHGRAEVTEARKQKFVDQDRGPAATQSFLEYCARVERRNHGP
jgi:hypothetical protein